VLLPPLRVLMPLFRQRCWHTLDALLIYATYFITGSGDAIPLLSAICCHFDTPAAVDGARH